VKVQKRQPSQTPREKLCATCGRPFLLEPDQKFFDCPRCYKKAHPVHKPSRQGTTQVLIQITCLECGTIEYLDFAPPDPSASLCRACYTKLKREPRPPARH
jgi:NMD protein affecting ribosome stability and mRNA decay